MALRRITAHSHNLRVDACADFLIVFNITVDDQCTIFREQFCKFMEGIADIVQIFKEIQMVRFNI